MDKPKAILKFKKQIKKIDELKSLHSESIEFERWRKITKLLIQETFGSNSDHYKDFSSISYNPMKMAFTGDSELQGTTEQEKKEVYIDGLSQAESLLKKILIDINEYPDVESDIKKKKL